MMPNAESERSDAGFPIVRQVFGFVKFFVSGAKRRQDGACRERGAGKGTQSFAPLSAEVTRSAPLALRFATFAHRISLHFDAVRVVNQPVQYAVGQRRIADLLVPLRYRQLRGQNR